MQLCSFTYEEKECERPVGTPEPFEDETALCRGWSPGEPRGPRRARCSARPLAATGGRCSCPHRPISVTLGCTHKLTHAKTGKYVSACATWGCGKRYLGQQALKVVIIKCMMTVVMVLLSRSFEGHHAERQVPGPAFFCPRWDRSLVHFRKSRFPVQILPPLLLLPPLPSLPHSHPFFSRITTE